MAHQEERLDLIIFGATGFSGKVAACEVVKLAKEKNVTWGIAGRNQSKLEAVLKEVTEKSGEDVTKVPVVIADVADEESLIKMASRARVILNCVGPYRFYGEAVVKSCLAGGAHHVDISGEPQYLERMQLEYNDMAADKGLYVVGACGLDSIPADLGVVFLKKKFQGNVNSVEMYMKFGAADENTKRSGPMLNFATYESTVYGLAYYNELGPLRAKLFPNRLPSMTPKLKARCVVHNRSEIGWCIPFLGADRDVVQRSQRHFFEVDKERPIQIQIYMLQSLMTIMLMGFFGIFFVLLSKFKCGRSLLFKYPRLFSGGLTSKEAPTEETRQNTEYKAIFFGDGWKEKATEPEQQYDTPPNKKMVVEVTCRDPAYSATTVMLILSAITILREGDKMPGRGGVYPPGAAFANTSLIDELNNHGIKFTVTSSPEE